MGIQLRQSPTGPTLLGTVDGQVVTWDAATNTWKAGDPPAAGGSTPIPLVLVVDPSGVGATPDGAWSGDKTFATLQAAYDALQANSPNTPATIWCAPGNVGALAMATGDSRALCIRSHGNQYSVPTTITSVLVSNACSGFELQDCVVEKDVIEEGGEGSYTGFTVFFRSSVGGNVTLPGATLYMQEDSSVGGDVLQVGGLIAHNLAFAALQVIPAFNVMSLDAGSEQVLMRLLGTALADGITIIRDDRTPSASAIVGPDADHTFQTDRNAATYPPSKLTAARVATLQNNAVDPRSFVVDVWRQDFDLTVKDFAATTLYTYTAGAPAIRLFFFDAAGGGNLALIGVENLEQT